MAAVILAGCAAAPPHVNAPPPPAPNPTAASPRASALAEQARRDVEQIRNLGTAAAVPPETAAVAPPSGPPQVQWLLPRGGEAQPPPAVDAAPTAQGALARARSQGAVPPAPAEHPAEHPGGQVVRSPDADRLNGLMVELCAELCRQGAYSKVPLRELLLIAATAMVTPDRGLVPDALPGLTERERELLGRMQEYFAGLGKSLQESGDPESIVKATEQLYRAVSRQPRLSLPKAVLCTRVGGFGDYDEFGRGEAGRFSFLAHTGQNAVVYVEVKDFTSELNQQNQWVTELSQQLVLYSDRDGIPVWREDWQPGTDSSRNRRGDFFIVQIITLPKQLSVGLYHLKIHVRDEKSHAEAETALELEMVADPRMTGAKP